ncbi:MAG: hypothetical protein ABIP44_02750 [Pseudoxanthomonas sp.]
MTNADRMQVVHRACTTAFDHAYAAHQQGNDEGRDLWVGIQDACALEQQDCVAAAQAGVL